MAGFLGRLKRDDLGQYKKVERLLQRSADHGIPLHHREKCRKLRPNLYEFKSYQVRLLFFIAGGGDIIITNGFVKRQDSTPEQEIERALRLRGSWEGAEGTGNG